MKNKKSNRAVQVLTIIATATVLTFANVAVSATDYDASNATFIVAANGQDRREDRRDDRGDRKDDRQDCRQEEGVGKDKRDCKQDGRQDRRDDD